MPEHPDYCSCFKLPGEWGQGGWHWRYLTEERALRIIDEWLAGKHYPPELEAAERQRMLDRAHTYIGQPWAFAPCEPWRKAFEREVLERKRKERQSADPEKVLAV